MGLSQAEAHCRGDGHEPPVPSSTPSSPLPWNGVPEPCLHTPAPPCPSQAGLCRAVGQRFCSLTGQSCELTPRVLQSFPQPATPGPGGPGLRPGLQSAQSEGCVQPEVSLSTEHLAADALTGG